MGIFFGRTSQRGEEYDGLDERQGLGFVPSRAPSGLQRFLPGDPLRARCRLSWGAARLQTFLRGRDWYIILERTGLFALLRGMASGRRRKGGGGRGFRLGLEFAIDPDNHNHGRQGDEDRDTIGMPDGEEA